MHNTMAKALIRAGYASVFDKRGVFKQGWNAKLSYRTHRQLVEQGYEKFSG